MDFWNGTGISLIQPLDAYYRFSVMFKGVLSRFLVLLHNLKLIRMKENLKIMAPSVLRILYYYPSITIVKPSANGRNINCSRTTPNNSQQWWSNIVGSCCVLLHVA